MAAELEGHQSLVFVGKVRRPTNPFCLIAAFTVRLCCCGEPGGPRGRDGGKALPSGSVLCRAKPRWLPRRGAAFPWWGWGGQRGAAFS